jgi:hypothetical protein
MQSGSVTPFANTSFVAPCGLRLQQVITSSGSVTIPAGINFVYAVVVGAGGSGGSTAGGGPVGLVVHRVSHRRPVQLQRAGWTPT